MGGKPDSLLDPVDPAFLAAFDGIVTPILEERQEAVINVKGCHDLALSLHARRLAAEKVIEQCDAKLIAAMGQRKISTMIVGHYIVEVCPCGVNNVKVIHCQGAYVVAKPGEA